jgi:hypothetical protein
MVTRDGEELVLVLDLLKGVDSIYTPNANVLNCPYRLVFYFARHQCFEVGNGSQC